MPVDTFKPEEYQSRPRFTRTAPARPGDYKINAGIGLRPSTISRLKAAADSTGRSKSDLAEEFILAGLDREDSRE